MVLHPRERLSRRSFLAAAGLAVPASAAMLAACRPPKSTFGPGGGIEIATPDNPVSLPLYDDNPAIGSGLPPEKDATLKLYNWDQYVNKKVLDDFAKEYECDVSVSTFNNMDEALNKIRNSPIDFDVFFPTTDILGKMAGFQLLQPLNRDYLPNLPKNVWPQLSDDDQPFYDVGSRYTVPYFVYTTGIGWRNDLVDEKDWPSTIAASGGNPYDALWDTRYKGKIGIYDDYREAMGMTMLRNGGTDVNTADEQVIEQTKNSLVELTDKVNVALTINGAYEELPKGIFVLHQAWSGDMLAAPYYGKGNFAATAPLVSYWWPKDKRGVVGNDTMAVLKAAKNPVLAHIFLNYLLDFEHSMKNMGWVAYQPPQNDAPPEAFADPNFKWSWVVPNNLLNAVVKPQDFDKGYIVTELPPEVDGRWHDAWEEFSSGM